MVFEWVTVNYLSDMYLLSLSCRMERIYLRSDELLVR